LRALRDEHRLQLRRVAGDVGFLGVEDDVHAADAAQGDAVVVEETAGPVADQGRHVHVDEVQHVAAGDRE
jgi:hypothetical protein